MRSMNFYFAKSDTSQRLPVGVGRTLEAGLLWTEFASVNG